jgi:tetratricopeptide (TPR) repeat protein
MKCIACFVLAVLMFAMPAVAEDLDRLFAQLHDPQTGSNVMRIEQQIWSAWMQAGTADENRLLAEATDAMNIGSFKTAEAKLDAMLARNQTYPEVWNKRATLYFMMGRYEDSLDDIVKTLDLEPRHFGALSGRGMVLMRMNRRAEALVAFKETLRIHPHLTGAKVVVEQLEKEAPEL